MKAKGIVVALVALLIMSGAAHAVDWSGKLGIGFRGQLYLPLNKGKNFALDGVSYEMYQMGPGSAGFIRYGLTESFVLQGEVEYLLTYDDTTATENQTTKWRDRDHARTHLRGHLFSVLANYYFNKDGSFQPYVLAGLGYDVWRIHDFRGGATYQVDDLGLKLGGGLSYWLDWKWWFIDGLSLEAQLKFTGGLTNLNTDMPEGFYGPGDWSDWDTRPFRNFIQPSAAIAIYFGGQPDADGDGVADGDDQCPGTPEKARVDELGCPLDTDGDGVYDGIDTCAATPAGVAVDAYGCPLDTDGDGVWDSWDECPGTPQGVQVDDQGCPLDGDSDGVADYQDECPDTPVGAVVDQIGCPRDTDGDGIYDGIDQCPNTMQGLAVDASGCMLDEDGDGVADELDECPNTPPLVNVGETGCPIATPIEETIVLSGDVGFAVNADTLTAAARASLDDDVVQPMRAYPDTEIRVVGFTDDTGPEGYNMQLSIQRAQSVRDYLVAQGIDSTRIEVTGHGEDPDYFECPNDTPKGRACNRRVEIETIQ